MKKILQNGLLTALFFTSSISAAAYDFDDTEGYEDTKIDDTASCVTETTAREGYVNKICQICMIPKKIEENNIYCINCMISSLASEAITSVKKYQAPFNTKMSQSYREKHGHAASGNQKAYEKKCPNCKFFVSSSNISCPICETNFLPLQEKISVKKHQAPSNAQVPKNYYAKHEQNAQSQYVYKNTLRNSASQAPVQLQESMKNNHHRSPASIPSPQNIMSASYGQQAPLTSCTTLKNQTHASYKNTKPSSYQPSHRYNTSSQAASGQHPPLSSLYGFLYGTQQASNAVHAYNRPNNVQNNSGYKPTSHKSLPSPIQHSAPSQMQMSSKQMPSFLPHPNPAKSDVYYINPQEELNNFLKYKKQIEENKKQVKALSKERKRISNKLNKLEKQIQGYKKLKKIDNKIKKLQENIQNFLSIQKIDYIIDFNLFYSEKGQSFIVGANKNIQLKKLLGYALRYQYEFENNNDSLNNEFKMYAKYSKVHLFIEGECINKYNLDKQLCEIFPPSPNITSITRGSEPHKEQITIIGIQQEHISHKTYFSAGILLLKGIIQKKNQT